MIKFTNMLKEGTNDSNLVRKMTGRLSKSDTALRLSRLSIDSVLRATTEFKKGQISHEHLGKIVMAYRKDLVDAAKSIAIAEKK